MIRLLTSLAVKRGQSTLTKGLVYLYLHSSQTMSYFAYSTRDFTNTYSDEPMLEAETPTMALTKMETESPDTDQPSPHQQAESRMRSVQYLCYMYICISAQDTHKTERQRETRAREGGRENNSQNETSDKDETRMSVTATGVRV